MSQAIRVTSDPWRIPIEDLGYTDKIAQHLINVENDAVHKARLRGFVVPKLVNRETSFELVMTCTVVLSEDVSHK